MGRLHLSRMPLAAAMTILAETAPPLFFFRYTWTRSLPSKVYLVEKLLVVHQQCVFSSIILPHIFSWSVFSLTCFPSLLRSVVLLQLHHAGKNTSQLQHEQRYYTWCMDHAYPLQPWSSVLPCLLQQSVMERDSDLCGCARLLTGLMYRSRAISHVHVLLVTCHQCWSDKFDDLIILMFSFCI